jgi:hypothetical protein
MWGEDRPARPKSTGLREPRIDLDVEVSRRVTAMLCPSLTRDTRLVRAAMAATAVSQEQGKGAAEAAPSSVTSAFFLS